MVLCDTNCIVFLLFSMFMASKSCAYIQPYLGIINSIIIKTFSSAMCMSLSCGSTFFLFQNFLNQFNLDFPLFRIMLMNIRQRKIKLELV